MSQQLSRTTLTFSPPKKLKIAFSLFFCFNLTWVYKAKMNVAHHTDNSKILLFLPFHETVCPNLRNGRNNKRLGLSEDSKHMWKPADFPSISLLSNFCTFSLCRDRLDLIAPRAQYNTHNSFPVATFLPDPKQKHDRNYDYNRNRMVSE